MSPKKLFYGWWVLAALLAFSMFGAGTVWYGFTAYFTPLVKEFGWTYTAISFAAAMRGIETGIGDLFVGFLVDRFGGRKLILGGTLLMSTGFLLLSRVSSLTTFYVYYFIVSVGVTSGASVVGLTILSRWFPRRVGTIFGIFTAGAGLSGFLLPLVIYLLDSFGFRTTFFIFGVSVLFVGLPVAVLVRDRPELLGYGPDGGVLTPTSNVPAKSASEERHGDVSGGLPNLGLKGVLRSRILWTLVLASASQVLVIQMVTTHIMPYLESIGRSRYEAGQVAMAVPVISVLGRLGFGWLGDRFDRRDMLIAVTSLQTAGILALAYAGIYPLMIPFLLFYGLGYGGMMPNRAAILRDYFGDRSFGTMLGIVVGLSVVVGLVGPVMAGRLYDTRGSYSLALMIAVGLLIVGVALLSSLKRPATPPQV